MDIISLSYFSELAKDLHITRTASRLYISQQTLSNHIQRLEEHYGTQLLQRKPCLALTTAGEAVLAFAELVTREQENLKSKLSDLAQETAGVIRFGASQLRIQASLPEVLPKFSARFPQVELRLTSANTAQLEPMVLNGSLDFAILLAHSADIDPNLVRQHLMDDPLYLCVSDALLTRVYGHDAVPLIHASRAGASVGAFSRLPFCTAANRVGTILQKCFDEAQATPNIYLADSDIAVSTAVCFQGLAACVLTKSAIQQQEQQPADLHMFPLLYHGQPIVQSLYLVYRKDRHQTRYADYFRALLTERFQILHHMEVITDDSEHPHRC